MSNIALIGASGNAGSRILKELVCRKHSVTAVARKPEAVEDLAGVRRVAGDVFDVDTLSATLKGHDAVISAVKFIASDYHMLVEAVRRSGVRRYIVVGGAGSLKVGPGMRLVDSPSFPPAYKPEAVKGGDFLEYLRTVSDLDWTFISPSALFVPGERTGKFRLGTDALLAVDNVSKISFEDFAVALVDELEKPERLRQRFTVGY